MAPEIIDWGHGWLLTRNSLPTPQPPAILTTAASHSLSPRAGRAARGTIVSLAFWLCLVTAAGLFAGVTLSPKLLARQALADRYRDQQRRLLQVEQQVEQLDRVVVALDRDAQFAAEIARLEFDAARPGEEIIPVDPALTLSSQSHALATNADTSRALTPWQPSLERLATDNQLRWQLLAGAAAIVVVAFTFLHEASEPVPAEQTSAPLRGLRARYRRQ